MEIFMYHELYKFNKILVFFWEYAESRMVFTKNEHLSAIFAKFVSLAAENS